MIRVLIVEDEKQLLRNLSRYLDSFEDEFEVLTAETAEDATEILAFREVDVLLTDVHFPGMSGIDLVRHAVSGQPHIKVAVMTAYSSPKTKNAAFNEGALRFIEKPLNLKDLRVLLLELGDIDYGWSGQVDGLDLFDFAQLMLWGRKTKSIHVNSKKDVGTLAFKKGQLYHAATKTSKGNEAFFEIAHWPDGSFADLSPRSSDQLEKNVVDSLEFLLIEAARRRDDIRRKGYEKKTSRHDSPDSSQESTAPQQDAPDPGDGQETKGKAIPMDILDSLNHEIEGFQVAALVGPDGLPLLMSNPAKIDINGFSKNFATMSQLASTTVSSLSECPVSEILVAHGGGRLLLRPIGKASLDLVIGVSLDAPLGNLRMVAERLASKIGRSI